MRSRCCRPRRLAATDSVCVASARLAALNGLTQFGVTCAAAVPASRVQVYEVTLLSASLNATDAVVARVGVGGAVMLGAAGAVVSIRHEKLLVDERAPVTEDLTVNVCDPSAREGRVTGGVQAAILPPSCAHW